MNPPDPFKPAALPVPSGALDPASIPPLPENATPAEKDAHWLKYVYQGDRQPQLTVRAVLMGGVLGMFMSISNLYTTALGPAECPPGIFFGSSRECPGSVPQFA